MPANKVRGEFNAYGFVLKPSFEALAIIEDTVCPILQITDKIEQRNLKVKDMANIVAACAGVSVEEAGNAIMQEGISSCYDVVNKVLEAAFFGGKTEEDKQGN